MTGAGATAPRIDHYDWAGGREPMLRFGPEAAATTVIVALPLLEEANRTRALACTMLRALAQLGIAGALPELPGTGESLVATADLRLADLRAAFAAATARIGGVAYPVAIRSGALLCDGVPAWGRDGAGGWAVAPQTGAELVREWRRMRDAGDGRMVAGNRVSEDFQADLADAEPSTTRIVRLAGDPRPADRVLAAAPPWRRAEPHGDPALAAALAEDIAQWITACAG